MRRFFGRAEHALDAKGRMFLPVKHRAHFPDGGYLTKYHGGCLALWTPEQFEVQMGDLESTQDASSANRNRTRLFSSGTEEVSLDGQGRIAIAPHLRAYAGLSGPEPSAPVLVIGVLNRVELWNPALYAETLARSERDLVIDAD